MTWRSVTDKQEQNTALQSTLQELLVLGACIRAIRSSSNTQWKQSKQSLQRKAVSGSLGLLVLGVAAAALARERGRIGAGGGRLAQRCVRARQRQPVLQLARRPQDAQRVLRQLLHMCMFRVLGKPLGRGHSSPVIVRCGRQARQVASKALPACGRVRHFCWWPTVDNHWVPKCR